ncbi:MAG: 3-oxoacyl-[acyl-carrier-protein] reductase FabG1 [Acidimicrobiales bacterium]|nr:MAG: SDR family oxidoreductase [Actinomycetota bacterium]MBV6509539.1 3-oxoacyl-[acyl-carrier-protein] reductase FabG1 [Acidimicrobiales bacterium]RIK06647.1 MAG: beta-ketoacyl-ACP reductase [Acidobacteriota bacterium]
MSRVALVTGANSGLGLVTARRFAKAGYRVAGTYRSQRPDGDNEILWVRADVTDADSLDSAFTEVEDTLGKVEILVSNAGMIRDTLFLRMSEADFTDILDVNLVGAFRAAKRAVRNMMRARWGRIIFVSSVAGRTGQVGQANYAASKAGLIGMARSIAREFASRGITVNVVAPGPFPSSLMSTVDDEQQAQLTGMVPLGRFGEVDEIAATIEFVASDDAGYMTGAVIAVDGGLGMGA